MASNPVKINNYQSPVESTRNFHIQENKKNKFKFTIFKTDKQRIDEHLKKQEETFDPNQDYWQVQTNLYSIAPTDINNLHTIQSHKKSPKKSSPPPLNSKKQLDRFGNPMPDVMQPKMKFKHRSE